MMSLAASRVRLPLPPTRTWLLPAAAKTMSWLAWISTETLCFELLADEGFAYRAAGDVVETFHRGDDDVVGIDDQRTAGAGIDIAGEQHVMAADLDLAALVDRRSPPAAVSTALAATLSAPTALVTIWPPAPSAVAGRAHLAADIDVARRR